MNDGQYETTDSAWTETTSASADEDVVSQVRSLPISECSSEPCECLPMSLSELGGLAKGC